MCARKARPGGRGRGQVTSRRACEVDGGVRGRGKRRGGEGGGEGGHVHVRDNPFLSLMTLTPALGEDWVSSHCFSKSNIVVIMNMSLDRYSDWF